MCLEQKPTKWTQTTSSHKIINENIYFCIGYLISVSFKRFPIKLWNRGQGKHCGANGIFVHPVYGSVQLLGSIQFTLKV